MVAPRLSTMRVFSLLAAALFALTLSAGAQDQASIAQPAPRLPYLDWNACPFEGCTYGNWTAQSRVAVFDTWKPNRKRIAEVSPKETVVGVSGIVITFRPGVIRLVRDLPRYSLRRGDTIFTYTYLGEGVSQAWFKGRFYPEFDISFAKAPDGTGCGRSDCEGMIVDPGKKVWWAKVQLKSGAVGWVNMDTARFNGIDRFALLVGTRHRIGNLACYILRPTS